jgi:hypothetical protein
MGYLIKLCNYSTTFYFIKVVTSDLLMVSKAHGHIFLRTFIATLVKLYKTNPIGCYYCG